MSSQTSPVEGSAAAATYPAHWTADVLLRDGHPAQLRPIRSEDQDGLAAFYEQVSDTSKYYRFFAPMPHLSERDLNHFANVDYVDRVAFVLLVAQQIVAVGRYEVIDATAEGKRAEVAFLVQDSHQGRGIGQLLLEHLAQAGRERGVTSFVAEVLPDNSRMIQVFRDAGYQVVSGYDEGVLHLEFSIDPTETAIGVIQGREHRAESASVAAFFNARSIAVIGASRKQDTIGQALVRHLVLGDYTGRVYAVNPTAESVAGLPSYDSVVDIPDPVDIALVAVPAEAVPDVVLDCAAKGVHGLIVISSGFAETGEEGRTRQRRLLGLARSYGLRLIGPNCLGIINTSPEVSLNASLAPRLPLHGRAGFFCQSGALGSAILENVNSRGLGLSTFVSAGNRADVSGNDLLQYWEEDTATEVILLYLESIGNPRKFSRIARRVSRSKPIIVVRSGRTNQGVPMGQLVGQLGAPQAAVDAMFTQAGIIHVDTLEEMLDVAQLIAHQPLPDGNRVAVVGNSDAIGLLAQDAAMANELQVTRSVALGAEATARDFEVALDDAIDDPDVDSVVAVYIPPLNVSGAEVAAVLGSVGEQSEKPLVSTFLGASGVPELLRIPDHSGSAAGRGSVPSYPAVESAVRALAHVVEYAAWLRTPSDPGEPLDGIDLARARTIVGGAMVNHPDGRDLTDDEVVALLDCYGISVWPRIAVATAKDAVTAGRKLGWDVVLKATDDRLRTRTDLAHVWRNIDSAAEMKDAWEAMARFVDDADEAGFVVQRNAAPGVPVEIAAAEDPLFGPTVSFSIAGPLSDLVGDRAYRIPPLSPSEALGLVREVKASPLMFGYRGSEPVDVDSVVDLLRRLSLLKHDLPQVRRITLGLVHATADGAVVLSARGRVEPIADNRSDSFVRRLAMPADTLHD